MNLGIISVGKAIWDCLDLRTTSNPAAVATIAWTNSMRTTDDSGNQAGRGLPDHLSATATTIASTPAHKMARTYSKNFIVVLEPSRQQSDYGLSIRQDRQPSIIAFERFDECLRDAVGFRRADWRETKLEA